ncbi:putative C-5 sterol desaturase [Talaromyces atroroseus]|uniref:Putative C-5 sterol desaturase n=1 Tax=Talaromyces atroroseus TaxID=1441469 RepID=A0A225AVA5_TALAT|nr:putative C-5 sterol desaturase [Talaromyces atroroseus]OKL62304.1 putative C-5 sterol desaturase [Talaromyces atroroseus]
MDVFLDVCDTFFFDRLYAIILPDRAATLAGSSEGDSIRLYNQHVKQYFPLQPSQWAGLSSWKREHLSRQALSLFLITWLFGMAMYLIGSTLLYHTCYDKRLLHHPKFLPRQIQQEIQQSLKAMPIMALLTMPIFLAEIQGWTKLYDFSSGTSDEGTSTFYIPSHIYTWLQYPLFIMFTDSGIYWIHRGLHHPSVYRWVHKRHHKWVVPTPYASYAFNPVDGWMQSLPYHIFPFLFPLQKVAYLGLFVFVTLWTVLIHDAEYISNSRVINGAACHTMHHLYFNYNYGQFTTFWDRVKGTYQTPDGDGIVKAFDENENGDQALKKVD